jgi:hypothetical protein
VTRPLAQASVTVRGEKKSSKVLKVPCGVSANGMVAVLRPCQHEKLARGAHDKEHAMSQKLNSAIAVIGIDIGKILRRAVPAYSEITWSSRWLCSAFA